MKRKEAHERGDSFLQLTDPRRLRTGIEESIDKLANFTFPREKLQLLSISDCNIGDQGFCILVNNLESLHHPELVTMNLS